MNLSYTTTPYCEFVNCDAPFTVWIVSTIQPPNQPSHIDSQSKSKRGERIFESELECELLSDRYMVESIYITMILQFFILAKQKKNIKRCSMCFCETAGAGGNKMNFVEN